MLGRVSLNFESRNTLHEQHSSQQLSRIVQSFILTFYVCLQSSGGGVSKSITLTVVLVCFASPLFRTMQILQLFPMPLIAHSFAVRQKCNSNECTESNCAKFPERRQFLHSFVVSRGLLHVVIRYVSQLTEAQRQLCLEFLISLSCNVSIFAIIFRYNVLLTTELVETGKLIEICLSWVNAF